MSDLYQDDTMYDDYVADERDHISGSDPAPEPTEEETRSRNLRLIDKEVPTNYDEACVVARAVIRDTPPEPTEQRYINALIDAVVTSDDWQRDQAQIEREGWDELERDAEDPGDGYRWDPEQGYVLVVCPGCHCDPCHCDTITREDY